MTTYTLGPRYAPQWRQLGLKHVVIFLSSVCFRGRKMLRFLAYDKKNKGKKAHRSPHFKCQPMEQEWKLKMFNKILPGLTLFHFRTLEWILVRWIWSSRDKRSSFKNYNRTTFIYYYFLISHYDALLHRCPERPLQSLFSGTFVSSSVSHFLPLIRLSCPAFSHYSFS